MKEPATADPAGAFTYETTTTKPQLYPPTPPVQAVLLVATWVTAKGAGLGAGGAEGGGGVW